MHNVLHLISIFHSENKRLLKTLLLSHEELSLKLVCDCVTLVGRL